MSRHVGLRERLIERVGGYSAVMTVYRWIRPRWWWRLTSPYGRPISDFVSAHGLVVLEGPFKGQRFCSRALGHSNYLGAKLAGTYEPPVARFLSERVADADVFVDLGSGDGYFPVAAKRLADVHAIGFETNRFEVRLAKRNAAANGVELEMRGAATIPELNRLPDGNLLLMSDVEGLEEELIDPAQITRLTEATMIVEVHEAARPNVVETLSGRFAATHEIERIFSAGGQPNTAGVLAGLDPREASLVAFDGHGDDSDSWMTFVPRSGPGR